MSEKKPNIIFIMTDQQRLDTINSLGYNYMHTPNLDRLVQEGTAFTNAFCCGATCVAARAALFTGMFPHNTGVYSFDHWSHHKSWIQDLADNNYHCVNIGKMHITPIYDNIGFHERRVIENKCQKFSLYGAPEDEWGWWLRLHGCERELNRHLTDPDWKSKYNSIVWDKPEDLHPDVFCGNVASSWIKSWNWNKPLFMQIGFPGPHEPYDPPQRFIDLYDDVEIPLPIEPQEDLSKKPIQHQAFRHFFEYTKNDESQISISKASESELVRLRKHYYANVSLIDEKIGEVLQTLDEVGQLDNSIIIFTSDHGDNLGDHGLPYKWLMYDSIVNIPLIISDFRKQESASVVDESLVSHIDLGPTVLDMAGINIPARLEGRSLLQNDTSEFVDTVFCEDNYLLMMREKNFKLVYYIGQFEDGELYDLQNDPDELNNLWHIDKYNAEKQRMLQKILQWLAMSNYKNQKYKTNEENKTNLRLPGSENFGPFLHGQVSALPKDKQNL